MVLVRPHPITHVRPNAGSDWSNPQSGHVLEGEPSRLRHPNVLISSPLPGSLLSPWPIAGPMASPSSLMDQASP